MGEKMKDIMKLARIQLALTALFIFFKLIRPSVLASNSPQFFKTILLSLPNFFEAVVGILILTGILLVLNDKLKKKNTFQLNYVYRIAVLLAAAYVTLQEFDVINFRSRKTFDQNDLIFSAIGLVIGYWIIRSVKPRIYSNS